MSQQVARRVGPGGAPAPFVTAVHRVPSGLRQVIVDVGQVGQLLVALVTTAVKHPRGYWASSRDEAHEMLRFCWFPVSLCVGAFCFLIGNYAHSLLTLAGGQSRLGTFFVMATAREISPFVTGMAVAGVMGTALTADLGARKVREELDALTVLGVDTLRTLVLPRVIAITTMMVLFNILGIAVGAGMAAVSGTVIGNTSLGAYYTAFFDFITVPELISTVVKTTLIGLFIGVVCAQKGLTVRGGPEGVGRAVNQGVVLCFAAVWIFNFVVNAVFLGLFPEMLVNR